MSEWGEGRMFEADERSTNRSANIATLTTADRQPLRKYIDYHAAGVDAVESISIFSCEVAVEIASTSEENLANCCLYEPSYQAQRLQDNI